MDIENLFRKGNSYKIIASRLGISESEVQRYCWSRYKTGEMDRADYKGTVPRYIAYGEEDYLFLVQKYRKVEKYLKFMKKDNLPPIKWVLEKYNNSWKTASIKALEERGFTSK